MHAATTLLSWALAGTPVSSTDIQAPDIAAVEFASSDQVVQITARDSTGEVSAEVFLWSDDAGRLRLDAAWPDGLAVSVVRDGETATVETADPAEVASRMDRLDVAIQQAAAAGDWKDCAAHVGLTVAACGLHPVLCAGEMYYAACECLPLLVEKFEGQEC